MAKRSRRSKRNYLKRGGAPAPVQTKRVRHLSHFASELSFDGWVPLKDAADQPILSKDGKPIMRRIQSVTWIMVYSTGFATEIRWSRSLLTKKNDSTVRKGQPEPPVKYWSDWSRTEIRTLDKTITTRKSVRVSANQSIQVSYTKVVYPVIDRSNPNHVENRCEQKTERIVMTDTEFVNRMRGLERAAKKYQENSVKVD